jgi:hypothetical protein
MAATSSGIRLARNKGNGDSMPIRTKIVVEADAEKFKASYAVFEKYRSALKQLLRRAGRTSSVYKGCV